MATAIMVGGKNDGLEVTIPPRMKIPQKMLAPPTTYFALSSDQGSVEILRGQLNGRWLSYNATEYVNAEQKDAEGRNVFHPSGTSLVDRCRASTKAGSWCKNEATEGTDFCDVHHRQKGEPARYTEF